MAARRSPLTAQFEYDPRTGQYRHIATGRFVPQSEVRSALDKYLDAKSDRVRDLAQQLQRREISLADWQRAMEREIALTHLASAAAAKGGWAQMTPADFGRVGSLVKAERKYLERFAIQIEEGLPLDGRFLTRAQLYAQAGRHTFHVMRRREMQARGLGLVRRILHARDSCPGCLHLASLGFRPFGEIPPPGEGTECGRNCHCDEEFAEEGVLRAAGVTLGEDAASSGGASLREQVETWHDTITAAQNEARAMGVQASYRNASLEAANLVNQSLRETHTLGLPLPEFVRADAEAVAENVRREGGDPAKVPLQFVGGPTASGFFHEILINPEADVWKDGGADLMEAVRRNAAKGTLSTDSPFHLMRNEMGHFQQFQTDPNQYLTGRWPSTEEEALARTVSGLAGNDPQEFVAEVFAGLVQAKIAGQTVPYGEDVMELYRKLAGRVP